MEKSEMITELMKDCLFIQKEKEISKAKGDFFNIFKILGLSTNEVRTHSAFISELLDPNGSHGQTRKFLDIFLDIIDVKILNIKEVTITKEKYISVINKDYTKGGNIDILIEIFDQDGKKHIIKIENKIHAADQRNQLLRYYDYEKESTIGLLYLTLFGTKPEIISTQHLQENQDYKVISYQSHINRWLENCTKVSTVPQIILTQIQQYIYLIKLLTNNNPYMEETKNLLKNNLDYLKVVKEINDSYNSLIRDCCKKIRDELKFGAPQEFYTLNENNEKINFDHSEYDFKYKFDQDNAGFFYQFFAYQKGTLNDQGKKNEYGNILLKEIDGFNDSGAGLGWKFPINFDKTTLEKSDKILLAINDENKLKKLIDDLKNELENDMLSFINLIREKKI